MKRFLNLMTALVIMSLSYAFGVALGGQELGTALAIGVGSFSAIKAVAPSLNSLAMSSIEIPDFTEKSDEEIEKLDAAEKRAYYLSKYEYQNAVERKQMQDQIDAMKEKDGDNSKTIKALEKQIEALKKENEITQLRFDAMTEKGNKDGEQTDLMKFIKRGKDERKQAGFDEVVVKAPALMTTANVGPNVTNGFNQLFGNYIDPEIYDAPKPENFILGLVDVQTAAGTENIWYVERENEEGDAQFIAEGSVKPLIDGEYNEKKAPIEEVAERWKTTNRLAMHAPSVVSDFREHANELIEQQIDSGVLLGNGTSPNLNGITNAAGAFVVPAALANYYNAANIFDVIMAVATQVRLANFKGELTCVLNTVWKAQMMGIKDTDNRYIIPPFVAPDGTQVGEVTVRFENKLPAGNILLGDLRKFKVRIAEDVIYAEGYENDDFSRNLTSRKLEAFLGTYLPANHVGAIVYDDIATVTAAIDAP